MRSRSFTRFVLFTACVGALTAASCGGQASGTGLMIVVDADAQVRAQATSLEIHVRSEKGGEVVELDPFVFGEGEAIAWPVNVALVPKDGDSARTVHAHAVAKGEAAEALVEARVTTAYVAGQKMAVRVTLESACVGATCGEALTCVGGACVDPSEAWPPTEWEPAECGNGVVEPGEDCDLGREENVDGSGCESNCTFSCRSDADCDDGARCNGQETCDAELHRCQAGVPLADGASCEDAVVGAGGDMQSVAGSCVDGICGAACATDEACDDGNPCNGAEYCHLEWDACTGGLPPDCDDELECTIDACDPVENPETGCVHTLVDEDGDGYAPEHLECDDERKGDCDDQDPSVHPNAERICGDGIDNNCIGTAADLDLPIWYQDCDGDGYAPASAPSMVACNKPAVTEQCLDWTQRTPSGLANIDCDDTYAPVNPAYAPSNPLFYDSGSWADRPYCRGAGRTATGSAPNFACNAGGTLSWDWNCDGQVLLRWTATADGCTYMPWNRCTNQDGWAGSAPGCGQIGSWQMCRQPDENESSCQQTSESRQQQCR